MFLEIRITDSSMIPLTLERAVVVAAPTELVVAALVMFRKMVAIRAKAVVVAVIRILVREQDVLAEQDAAAVANPVHFMQQ